MLSMCLLHAHDAVAGAIVSFNKNGKNGSGRVFASMSTTPTHLQECVALLLLAYKLQPSRVVSYFLESLFTAVFYV